MLEKSSKIVIDTVAGRATKTLNSHDGALVEKMTLDVLRTLQMQSLLPSSFLVPAVDYGISSETAISMTYIEGARLHEVIGRLNLIIEYDPSARLIEKALHLKSYLLSRCIENITAFQNTVVQQILQKELGQHVVRYDYQKKLIEAIDYIRLSMEEREKIPSIIIDEITLVCNALDSESNLCFRDSVLKNQIIEGISNSAFDGYSKILDWRKRSDSTSATSKDTFEIAEEFKDSLLTIDLQSLKIYNHDFEQASQLVAVVDDWNQILTAEVLGIPYEDGLAFAQKHLGIEPELYHYSVLFRSLRAWARRLFYRSERPSEWLARYGYESIGYHYFLTIDALECLRNSSSQQEFLGGLHKWLLSKKPISKPWPWHISPTKHWMV